MQVRGQNIMASDTPHYAPLKIRTYGTAGPVVIVLHGGPAAVGNARSLAQPLSDSFRAVEPWQRGSGAEPLTVARHVADLHDVVRTVRDGPPPALVGESWGAMLALAYSAAHPEEAGPLVLVGCGTFDTEARARFHGTLDERTDDELNRRLDRLADEFPDPGERLKNRYELIKQSYDWDALPCDSEPDDAGPFDMRAHNETWNDMLRLQDEGVYPAAFAAIRSPVLMLHGAYDPHPGPLIRASLQPYLRQLQYREWPHCGHSPWIEREVRDEFFAVLRDWLRQQIK